MFVTCGDKPGDLAPSGQRYMPGFVRIREVRHPSPHMPYIITFLLIPLALELFLVTVRNVFLIAFCAEQDQVKLWNYGIGTN